MEQIRIGQWCNTANIGYIRTMRMVATTDIVLMDEPLVFHPNNEHRFSLDGLVLKPDAKIYTLDFYKRECTFTEKHLQDEHGNSHTIIIALSMVGQAPATLDFLYKTSAKKWVVFFTDQNGQNYVAGSLELPMKLQISRSIEQRNGLMATLTAKSWHPAWFFDMP